MKKKKVILYNDLKTLSLKGHYSFICRKCKCNEELCNFSEKRRSKLLLQEKYLVETIIVRTF